MMWEGLKQRLQARSRKEKHTLANTASIRMEGTLTTAMITQTPRWLWCWTVYSQSCSCFIDFVMLGIYIVVFIVLTLFHVQPFTLMMALTDDGVGVDAETSLSLSLHLYLSSPPLHFILHTPCLMRPALLSSTDQERCLSDQAQRKKKKKIHLRMGWSRGPSKKGGQVLLYALRIWSRRLQSRWVIQCWDESL